MLDLQALRVSYAAFNVASCLSMLRVNVNLTTGRFDLKERNISFDVIQKFFKFCVITKAGQLAYTIASHILHVSRNKGALDLVIYNATVLVLVCMALICSLELDKNLPTALVLYGELGLEKPSRILKKRKTVIVGSRWRRVLWKTKIKLTGCLVESKQFFKQVSRLPKRSYLEVVIFVAPLCIFFIPAAWVLQTAFNPTLGFCILSIFPEPMQVNQILTLAAICFETAIAAFSAFTVHFAFVNQLLAVLTIREKIEAAFKSVKQIRPHLVRTIELVCFEVSIPIVSAHFYNLVWRRFVFVEKQTALYCAITCTFYTLTRFRLSPIGVGAVVLSVNSIVLWLVSSAKVFMTTEQMESIRKELRFLVGQCLLRKDGNVDVYTRRLLVTKARIRALAPIGFSEGGFRCLHRESALEFMDFYISQVAFLLLTFS